MAQAENDNTTIDVFRCDTVELSISSAPDGARIWLHINGELRARIYRIGELTIHDRRTVIGEDGQ